MTIVTNRLKIAVALAIAALSTGACGRASPEAVESDAVVPVKTAPAAVGAIRGVIHATGMVTPAPGAELVVVAPEAARIGEIPRGEGERVRRGDVLVRFEIPSLTAEVETQAAEVQRAQAALANAKANQTRAHDLFDRAVAARKEVEDADRAVVDAQAGVAQADAARAAAGAAASRAIVRATFDGVVAKRYHNPGDVVEASVSDPVLRVIDLNRLEVVASIPLSDASRVTVGASGRITAPSAAEAPLKVISRPAAVDAGTATVPVRLAFTAHTRLPAYAPVQVDVDAELHTGVVLVPAAALVHEGEQTAVFVAKGSQAERRVVQTGLSDAEHVEIASGLNAGERVIVEGQAGLPDGAAITTDTPARPGASPAENSPKDASK
jgi:RND family efflux transporter MFP subunit